MCSRIAESRINCGLRLRKKNKTKEKMKKKEKKEWKSVKKRDMKI